MRIFFQKPKAVPYHQANKDKRPAESQHCCLQQCQWQLIQLICVVCVKYKAEPNSMKLKKLIQDEREKCYAFISDSESIYVDP